jgi:antitoxin component HigA of HigAB toxin-antitoxin module
MNIKPIRTKANYRAALKEIESLMSAKANTPAGAADGDAQPGQVHGPHRGLGHG